MNTRVLLSLWTISCFSHRRQPDERHTRGSEAIVHETQLSFNILPIKKPSEEGFLLQARVMTTHSFWINLQFV